jgi:hypothetical protein
MDAMMVVEVEALIATWGDDSQLICRFASRFHIATVSFYLY